MTTRVHLIGICGTAMATLAAMLKKKGLDVRGSDADVYPPMSDFLAAEGIPVFSGYRADATTTPLRTRSSNVIFPRGTNANIVDITSWARRVHFRVRRFAFVPA